MAYSRTTWVDGTTPAINATNLNNIEAGLVTADANATTALSTLSTGAAAGKVLGGTGPTFAYPPGYEVGYDQITGSVTVTSTTEASGTTVITGSSHTFDGAAVICEFFSPEVATAAAANAAVIVSLFLGATQIGRLAVVTTGTASSDVGASAVLARYRFTPSAGAHTYSVTAYQSGGNAAVVAGAAGTGTALPAYLRFTKV